MIAELILTGVIAIAFIGKAISAAAAPDVARIAEWSVAPQVAICDFDETYMSRAVDFWKSKGFELEVESVHGQCPDLIDGYILISIDQGSELTVNQLGKTVFPFNEEGEIRGAHIYLQNISEQELDQITLTHELGHALGFGHTKTNVHKNIMNPHPLRQKWKF